MKAFIYDMDGVIVDTEPVHIEVEQAVLRRVGVEAATELLMPYRGTSDVAMYADLKQRFGFTETPEELTQRKSELFQKVMHERGVVPIEGILPLIEKTAAMRKGGLRTAIASSSSEAFISFVVDSLAIRGKFDLLMSGTTLPRSKPDPAIYLRTAEQLGVHPADCVVLEDAGNGARAAKAAGMHCIGFRSPHSCNQDLSMCDRIVNRIDEIDLSKW